MTVLLATLSALMYGLSDFVGGLVSRRASAWAVAGVTQVASACAMLVFALFQPGSPTGADFGWAALGGLAAGFGTGFLYRGLSSGRMAVVAPISGVGAALVPLVVGAASGERPAALAWLGLVIALPGIWLVSSTPAAAPAPARAGVTDGVLAGLGFGLLFACFGQVPERAGLWPLVVGQVMSVAGVIGVATLLGAHWLPRTRASGWGVAGGVLGAAAALLFVLASQHGDLSIAGVISSLYPAGTILAAAVVLREHVHRMQGIGLLLCGAAVVLVAAS
jgi:uncharacterized membrane protein